MIQPSFLYNTFKNYGLDFYVGVPDSLLKNFCAYITDTLPIEQNIIAANEGGAIGIAAGYYLATNKIPIVYMQNSGEGNIINPLASLIDKEVYNIPILLLIGWRGKPGVPDEPQHVKQGKITTGLLNTMGINYTVLSKDEEQVKKQIRKAVTYMQQTNECYALVIEKESFDSYTLHNTVNNGYNLSREEAIETVVDILQTNAVVISTTGMISRELFEIRERRGESHEQDFLTVGSMGHASQIALGIALQQPNRPIYCFDGDGASIMHMGNMAITAQMQPRNYIHIIYNNGAHDSVGGQPTVGLKINLEAIAKQMGYKNTYSCDNVTSLKANLQDSLKFEGPTLIEVKVKKGNRKDLGRPTTTPKKNKIAFMNFLNKG